MAIKWAELHEVLKDYSLIDLKKAFSFNISKPFTSIFPSLLCACVFVLSCTYS